MILTTAQISAIVGVFFYAHKPDGCEGALIRYNKNDYVGIGEYQRLIDESKNVPYGILLTTTHGGTTNYIPLDFAMPERCSNRTMHFNSTFTAAGRRNWVSRDVTLVDKFQKPIINNISFAHMGILLKPFDFFNKVCKIAYMLEKMPERKKITIDNPNIKVYSDILDRFHSIHYIDLEGQSFLLGPEFTMPDAYDLKIKFRHGGTESERLRLSHQRRMFHGGVIDLNERKTPTWENTRFSKSFGIRRKTKEQAKIDLLDVLKQCHDRGWE